MEDNTSIKKVAEELRSDDPLQAFQPDDVQSRFFIGEAIIIAAATVFVTSFLKGVNEALEERGKELGKSITNWIVDKIEGLFRKPKEAKVKEDELKKDLQEYSTSASKIDPKTRKVRLDATEEAVVKTLKERGVTERKARAIAKVARKAAEDKISQMRA